MKKYLLVVMCAWVGAYGVSESDMDDRFGSSKDPEIQLPDADIVKAIVWSEGDLVGFCTDAGDVADAIDDQADAAENTEFEDAEAESEGDHTPKLTDMRDDLERGANFLRGDTIAGNLNLAVEGGLLPNNFWLMDEFTDLGWDV